MPDFVDHAAEREQADRDDALARHRARPRPAGDSAYSCRSCGERIPEARRQAVPGTNVCGFCARQLTGPR